MVLLWDASGLTKRYAVEPGTQTVNALWRNVPSERMAAATLTFTETYATILRRRNSGAIDAATFAESSSSLKLEILGDPDFILLNLNSADFIDATDLVRRHNINASDAVILTAFLRFVEEEAAKGNKCVLVASDTRLVRAAIDEGLHTLNPMEIDPRQIPSVLSA